MTMRQASRVLRDACFANVANQPYESHRSQRQSFTGNQRRGVPRPNAFGENTPLQVGTGFAAYDERDEIPFRTV
jgi:hypothetical protein